MYVLRASMTVPAACGGLAWPAGGRELAAEEGKAAAVRAKPASSRRLRRLMSGGSAAIEERWLGFMESALFVLS
jgi:hypothetical protein